MIDNLEEAELLTRLSQFSNEIFFGRAVGAVECCMLINFVLG